ncbi:hypothetical protein [Tomitella biformata]|uniref:hypothetical protein n=1 Tax=Tomitella biformata TaxID=630403 RepID=UPI0004B9504C|nr:hypothetical protein [Tomitella biformata]
MTRLLTTQFADRIAVYRELLNHVAATGWPSHPDPRWPVDTDTVEGPSLTTPHLRIHVAHSYQDGADVGSFPAGVEPVCLRIHVQGYSDQYPDREAAGTDLADAVPEEEGEAWARALLGQWSDYAYELTRQADAGEARSRMWFKQRIYVLFLAPDGTPLLAPDNTAWPRIWERNTGARKLDPDPSSTELLAHIAQFGPYAVTEGIRDPHTEPDGGWRLAMTGLPLDGLTDTSAATARQLRDAVRVRGAVDSKFRPIRVHLERATAVVHFRWARNPNTFAVTLRLPQTRGELPGPPMDTPRGVAYEALGRWQEGLRTGFLVRGTRRRIYGVIHLSAPPHTPGPRSREFGIAEVLPLAWGNAEVLAVWLEAYVNNEQGLPFVGQAAARWSDETTAHVEVLEVTAGTPDTVVAQLAHAITHRLADLGAETIETPFRDEHLVALGYVARPDGQGMALDVTSMP